MTIIHEVADWYLLGTLLEWVKVLAATHIGFRFVRAYAKRTQDERTQLTLQRRVRELEQLTESLGAHLQQAVEAERFATALMLRRDTRQPRDAEPVNGEGNPATRGR